VAFIVIGQNRNKKVRRKGEINEVVVIGGNSNKKRWNDGMMEFRFEK
jgi:hypothetical protein